MQLLLGGRKCELCGSVQKTHSTTFLQKLSEASEVNLGHYVSLSGPENVFRTTNYSKRSDYVVQVRTCSPSLYCW
jgi:hypothetical protein